MPFVDDTIFINIPDSGSPSWKAPVDTAADLPATGNNNGDARITQDTDTIYVWNGTTWVPVATPGAAIALDGLIGDVTATGPGVAVATVQFVGGVSAANVASGANSANAATSTNTPNTIVKRDGSGNFAAGTITANLTGVATNATLAVNFSGSLSGDVTGTQTTTAISSTVVTGKLLTGYSVGPNTPLAATDSILQAFGKVQGQLSATSGSAITALTGDGTATGPGSVPFTLATVNANVGSFGSSTSIPNFTVNAKGLITAVGSNVVIAPAGTLSGTTLNATVVNSSLTSVGTLTSLNVAGNISAANFSGSSSGTNTGDVTLAAFGSTPNNNGASLSGQVLTLQPADNTHPGGVSTTTQTFGGNKTFSGQTAVSNTSTTAFTINSTAFVFDATNNALGIGVQPSTNTFIDGVNSTGATKRFVLTGYGVGSVVGTRGRFARGTSGTPAAAQAGDVLNFMSGQGYGTSQFPAASTGVMNLVAAETFTNTSNATYATFSVTPTGAVTSSEALRINSTGNILIGTTTDNGNNKLQVNGSFLAGTATLTDAANIATNASLANRFTVTLAGNRNLSAPTNPTDGQKVIWIFTQDATGGRTLSFDAIFDFGNMPTLILSSAANKRDYLGAIYNSAATKWDCVAYSSTF